MFCLKFHFFLFFFSPKVHHWLPEHKVGRFVEQGVTVKVTDTLLVALMATHLAVALVMFGSVNGLPERILNNYAMYQLHTDQPQFSLLWNKIIIHKFTTNIWPQELTEPKDLLLDFELCDYVLYCLRHTFYSSYFWVCLLLHTWICEVMNGLFLPSIQYGDSERFKFSQKLLSRTLRLPDTLFL